MRGDVLIADADIDVTEIDDVADVLRSAIIVFVLHGDAPSLAARVLQNVLLSLTPCQGGRF
jgi:hypothetical protein